MGGLRHQRYRRTYRQHDRVRQWHAACSVASGLCLATQNGATGSGVPMARESPQADLGT